MERVDRIANGGVARHGWRELGWLALHGLGAGLIASLALALAVFIITFEAHAADHAAAKQGALLLQDDVGEKMEAPLLFTDVHMDVTGMLARVRVRQRFANPFAEWREGVYVFPLSDKAAVDHMTMRIGDRVVEGQIKERGEARRTYDNANVEGRKATLIEQERPNLFSTSVANIGPNEEIIVEIEYQETLRYDDGSFSLRFPLAITPRYVGGGPIAAAHAGIDPAAHDQGVIDADRISPPMAEPCDGFVNPVTMTIDLNAGFPLSKVASTYHAMNVEEHPGHRYRLMLLDGPVPAERDFELQWTPDVGSAPGAALFTETRGDKTYALLMALPASAPDTSAARMPREITYVVDTSGSMEGVSMTQAREALLLALDRLQAGDRFNVIEFNSKATPLWSSPMPTDRETLRQASAFVRGLRAGGGTDMLPALRVALSGERQASMIRQVVFLTDGAVGNEDAILELVHAQLGDRRLFTVGIGPAPNTFFLTKAAQFGRGSFTFIGDVREVKDRMIALFRKLETPAMTDIAIEWPGASDAWPRIVPDLYAGEPIVVAAQFPAGTLPGQVAINAKRGGSLWHATLPFSASGKEAGVGVLWARAKIDALMDAGRQGLPEQDVRDAVLHIALTHHLVSKYTSLVAVDVTPTRPAGVDVVKTALPGNVPQGLTGFGKLPRTATPAALSLFVGLVLLLAALMLMTLRRAALRRRT